MKKNEMTHTVDLSKEKTPLPSDYQQMVQAITKQYSTDDFQVMNIGETLCYMYFTTIVNEERLFNEIFPRLKTFLENPQSWEVLLPNSKIVTEVEKATMDLMNGNVVLIHREIKGKVISIPLAEFEKRAVEQPEMEKVLFGPKVSYNEDLQTNVSLLRRYNKDVNLTIKYFTVGERSKNKGALVYYQDIANPEWVKEIEEKINQLNIDRLLGHKDLMNKVIGKNQTVFPLYELIESPVRSTHFLHEGRILLLLDGTPFGAMVPMIFINMFFASEYYTQGNIIAILVRLIRFTSATLALFLPAFYVALVGVNSSIVPTELGILIASDRASIPYPIVVEIIVLFIILDIFLETTAYVPGNIGSALNIVGSLVIGQAAAQANLISQMSIIIAAITAIGTYLTLHQLSYALRAWKYPMFIAAAFLGFYGMICCSVIMFGHLCRLKSLNVPYMSPLAPMVIRDIFKGLFPIKDGNETNHRMSIWRTTDKTKQIGDVEK